MASQHGIFEASRGNSNVLGEEPLPETPKLTSGLHPCIACGGYHYIPKCIYTLPWSDWLAYQYQHMPSQLDQIAGAANIYPDQLTKTSLVERFTILDALAHTHRPNYVGKSRMKADIMTSSTIESYWHEEIWRGKLQSGSAYCTRKAMLQRGSPSFGEVDGDGFESEDEGAKVEEMKGVFAIRLPMTSNATLFDRNAKQVGNDEGWEFVERPEVIGVQQWREEDDVERNS